MAERSPPRSVVSRLIVSRKTINQFPVKRIGSALLLLALASPLHAISITFGDIEITPEPAPKGTSSHGYFEYAFHIVNRSAERAYVVSLSMPFERSFGPGDAIRELRRTVQVGAKDSVLVSLFQPDHPPLGGEDVTVSIDGRRQERRIQLKPNQSIRRFHSRYATSSGLAEPLILVGTRVKPLPTMEPAPGTEPIGMAGGAGSAVPPGMTPPGRSRLLTVPLPPQRAGRPAKPGQLPPEEVLEETLLPLLILKGPASLGAAARLVLAGQMGKIRMPLGKPGLPPRGFEFVRAQTWSTNWLAYSRYDGIILTAEELSALPAGIQTALWQYVETGGALLVLGQADLLGLSTMRETTEGPPGWRNMRIGFGSCRISPDANYDVWDGECFSTLMNDWRGTASSWSSGQRNTLNANQEFPVIDDLGIPVKGLFLLMFLFTLGIGPINIMVLTKMKRRIWLLWTTPILSLFTCLAVFGYMLIFEGWSGRLSSETLTFLDETTHRATTIGWTGVYSPLTPSDGLHFSHETEVVPQRYFEGQSNGARSCTIDWTQDQHFVSGWVEARVPAHFKVRKSELRRERVALQREQDGHWSMVNGLGKPLRRFWFADASGQVHTAENVAPGARVMLTLTEKETIPQKATLKDVLGFTSWTSKIKDITTSPTHFLRPGLYLAEVDDSPFLEVALQSARTHKLHALIIGFGNPGPRASASGEKNR